MARRSSSGGEEACQLGLDRLLEGRPRFRDRRREPGPELEVGAAEAEEDSWRSAAAEGLGEGDDVAEGEGVARGGGRTTPTEGLEGKADERARRHPDDAVDDEETRPGGEVEEVDGVEPRPPADLDPPAEGSGEAGQGGLDGERADPVVAAGGLPADEEADPGRPSVQSSSSTRSSRKWVAQLMHGS